MLKAELIKGQVILEKTDKVLVLYQRYFGELKNNSLFLSLYETYYLIEKRKIIVYCKGRELSIEDFYKKAIRYDKNFFVKSAVFSDLRSRGYVVKSALKFGAEFRVYDKGVKPGQDHAKWVVFPVHEKDKFSWYEFSAKNRVAHSTRKKLLIAIVDEEQKPTYYEMSWIRP